MQCNADPHRSSPETNANGFSLADHLIFTAKETKTGGSRRSSAASSRSTAAPTKNGGTENLNNHPVLAAMRQRRLPSVRPNYEYFAALLKAENQVLVKPRRCWILVAHEHYAVAGHEHVDEDGNPLETTYTAHNKVTGAELGHPEDYPYLRENLFKESWPREERTTVNGALLHQYTKSLEQVESCSANEMSALWTEDFPELAKRLDLAVEESVPEWDPVMVNPHRCEILHYHLTLELQRRPFPKQSELYPWVEINVEQASLANHRWKVVTRLVRPKEFVQNGTDRTYDEFPAAEMRVQPVHRPGCDGNTTGRDCDCRRRQQVLNVPFPADVMAKLLSKCVEYPAHPLIGSAASDESKDAQRGSRGKKTKPPTQMELVPQVAMCQEIYSCPADMDDGSKKSDPETDPKWKRRAMILWSFETIHSTQMKTEEKTKRKYESLVTAPSGKATWRFLSAIDPTSRHHQERTLIRGDTELESGLPSIQSMSTAASRHLSLSRESMQSPSPNYQQQFSAGMSENLGTAWDTPTTRGGGMFAFNGNNSAALANGYHHSGQGMYQPSLTPTGPGGLSILASQQQHHHHPHHPHAGLQTPPPTSSLNGSFAHSFDNGSQQQHSQQDMRDPSMSFISVTSADTDGYLAATAAGRAYNTNNLYPEMDPTADPSFNNWATNGNNMPALDTRLYSTNNWQPQYNNTAANRVVASSLEWVPSPHESPINNPHTVKEAQQQQPPQSQQHLVVTSSHYDQSSPSVSPKASTIHRDSQDSWVDVQSQSRITPATELSPQDWEVIENQPTVPAGGEEQMYLFPAAEQRSPPQQKLKRGRDWDDEGPVNKMARLDRGEE
jgi:transcriptional enhancer factor